ncbi:MAG TPA: exodeoxyribonuclease VII large subunit [Bacteroidales bacterium]|jgi:exodeoxyribonuclease VII large subunit|nr:exodeoxyribonuclease VII large subunit [Bacteroidales bacterium]HQB36648.1 exodeoxyribonuclease VII large subunit [Bacteroidales bacterium]
MDEKLTLTELQLTIRDSLYIALPDWYWVIAEISEIKENYSGHCYLELIEKHPEENDVKARIKAIIWNNRYSLLRAFFENITGESLKPGLKILVKTKIEYHEIYGLSLIISDIDPSYTIGEMALKRQMIIKKLEEEGVFSMNRELSFPLLPQRIAVISSGTAAGYSDFVKHLHDNSYGYVFYTALFESVMQGAETEKSVINSLNMIADHPDLFDVLVIIRGGGSQSDLSWFDSYNIAYYITQFPIPVITGIGHEKDLSVTDMVAYRPLKTPTAVADFLIDCVASAEAYLNEMSTEIAELSQSTVKEYLELIESYRLKLIPLAKLLISDQKENLSNRIIEVINFGKEFIMKARLRTENQKSRLLSNYSSFSMGKKTLIEKEKYELIKVTGNSLSKMMLKLDGLQNNLKILNPENVLKRGFTITSVNGRIIKNADSVSLNDIIETQFSDGKVGSRVLNKNINKNK